MNCPGQNPNADLFVCVNGGWVPTNHELAAHAPPPTQTNDFAPPLEDEWTDVETYPGSGMLTRVRTRTADPTRWFKDGKRYRHPYGFVIRVEGTALVQMGGTWRWCQRLVIIETSGDPGIGHVLHARLFAATDPWERIEE